jgi:hypothetical protein
VLEGDNKTQIMACGYGVHGTLGNGTWPHYNGVCACVCACLCACDCACDCACECVFSGVCGSLGNGTWPHFNGRCVPGQVLLVAVSEG